MPANGVDTFVVDTHRELTTLASKAGLIRARMPVHRACPDRGACKHCAKLLVLHERINDHLDQLEEDDETRALLAALDAPPDPFCGDCGCARYVCVAFPGLVACAKCDGLDAKAGVWRPVNMGSA